jgi:hypothetical protein
MPPSKLSTLVSASMLAVLGSPACLDSRPGGELSGSGDAGEETSWEEASGSEGGEGIDPDTFTGAADDESSGGLMPRAELLAEFDGEASDIVVDNSYVYWTDLQVGGVARTPLAGGEIEQLVPGGASLMLDIVGERIFWTEIGDADSYPSRVRSSLVGGGPVFDHASQAERAGDLSLVDDYLYWSYGPDGGANSGIRRQQVGGGGVEEVHAGMESISRIEATDGALFFSSGNRLYRSQLDGSELDSVGLLTPPNFGMEASNGYLYFSDNALGAQAVSLGGGPIFNVGSHGEIRSLTVDESHLYYSHFGHLSRVAIDDGQIDVVHIHDNKAAANFLTNDDTHVYWTVVVLGGGSEIWRCAK